MEGRLPLPPSPTPPFSVKGWGIKIINVKFKAPKCFRKIERKRYFSHHTDWFLTAFVTV